MTLHIDQNGVITESGLTVYHASPSAVPVYLSTALITLLQCAVVEGNKIAAVKYLRETFRELSLTQCLRLVEYVAADYHYRSRKD